MEIYTLNRNFHAQDIIDKFESFIWTERYYGDGEVELVVPATKDMIQKLPEGTFLGIDESDEIMILETSENKEGKIKFSGISLLPWLNNRFIRTTAIHADRYWNIKEMTPGEILGFIVENMCIEGSPYLNGEFPTGIPNPEELAIPGLYIKDLDNSGEWVNIAVPFGPVYDALKEIATTYQIGIQLTLDSVTSDSYTLGFKSYKGLDRTSGQNENSQVRFSPDMDSLSNIEELRSIAALKTRAYSFVPGLEAPYPLEPGVSSLSGSQYTGFDLRALMVFAEDITTDTVEGLTDNELRDILNNRAIAALVLNSFKKFVDGEIVPTDQFKFGVHYNLGDIIEIQGNTEIIQTSRITEYIRTQDESGETSYPTLETVDQGVI